MNSSRGFISLGLILVLLIALAALGGAGHYMLWRPVTPQHETQVSTTTATESANPKKAGQKNMVPNPTTAKSLKLTDGQTTGFLVDNTGTVYFDAHDGSPAEVLCVSPDISTLKPLPDQNGNPTNYAVDKNRVYHDTYVFGSERPYCGGEPLSGVDPLTFMVLTDFHWNTLESTFTYSKDKNRVYFIHCEQFCGVDIVAGADPVTFFTIQGNDNMDAKDKNHSYQYGKIVQ